jgi:L-lactate dehydrogenase (cytochrome)
VEGTLVVKGIMSADDARIARDTRRGRDHRVRTTAGRQLESTVSPLRVLPDIARARGGMTVMMDSGVRADTHVLKALGLGASFVFVGRPFNYAAVDRRGRRACAMRSPSSARRSIATWRSSA